jgi:hypothetical protein
MARELTIELESYGFGGDHMDEWSPECPTCKGREEIDVMFGSVVLDTVPCPNCQEVPYGES